MSRTRSKRSRRPYAGIGARDRVQLRKTRLLDAGFDLLGTEGLRATTVRAVCARAGLTTRYFYESFRDVDALMLAVFDRLVADATGAVLAGIASAPRDVRAKSRAAIAAFLQILADDPRKARVGFVESLGSESLARRRSDAEQSFARLVAAQAREFYGAPKDADRIVDVTAYMLTGGLMTTILAWLDGTIAATREQIVEDLADLVVAAAESATAIAVARRRRRK